MPLTREEKLIRHREYNRKHYEKMKLDEEKMARKRQSWLESYHSRYSRKEVREWKSEYNRTYLSRDGVSEKQRERLSKYAKTEKRKLSMLTYRAKKFVCRKSECPDGELVAATVKMMLLKRAIRKAKEAKHG